MIRECRLTEKQDFSKTKMYRCPFAAPKARRGPRSGCRFYGDIRQDPDYSQLLIKISFVRFTLIMFCGILSKYEHLSGFDQERHSSAECCCGNCPDEKACRAAPHRRHEIKNGGSRLRIGLSFIPITRRQAISPRRSRRLPTALKAV